MTPDELAQFEIVVAAPHSALRSSNDQTARMIAAVQTPGVHILGHPRGRMYGSRPGVTADWEHVFMAAARFGVAIELDGDPARQDLDYDLARRAVASGCLFAIDSDAHATDQWWYAETGPGACAHCRRPAQPRDQLLAAREAARLGAVALTGRMNHDQKPQRQGDGVARSCRRCRKKFLRFFPGGFRDETYVDWERGYKWQAHQRWQEQLSPAIFRALLATASMPELAARAVKIESRTNLLFSFEKMALRDAVKSRPAPGCLPKAWTNFCTVAAATSAALNGGARWSVSCRAGRRAY